jgi:hypothetical protein
LTEALAQARAAFDAGEWDAAARGYEALLGAGGVTAAEALDGLGQVRWLQGRVAEGMGLRERAYAEYCRLGDRAASALGVATGSAAAPPASAAAPPYVKAALTGERVWVALPCSILSLETGSNQAVGGLGSLCGPKAPRALPTPPGRRQRPVRSPQCCS